jgi:hypothetical protein
MFFTLGLNRELFFLTEKLHTTERKDWDRRGPHGTKRIWMTLAHDLLVETENLACV